MNVYCFLMWECKCKVCPCFFELYFDLILQILCYGQCIYRQLVQCDHNISSLFTMDSYIFYCSAMSFVFAFLQAYYNLLEKRTTLDLLCMLYYLCFSKRKL
ncbi:hypothetical protein NL108_011874 [Boleophthalmus pectinirostris]|nr:hypothetical protein NL108_011874 [Boleophthalmus pectinirostris]